MMLPPPHVRFLILGHSMVAEATLERYFDGRRIQPGSRVRIEQALQKLGLTDLIKVEEQRS